MVTNSKEYAREHYLKNKDKYISNAKAWIKSNRDKRIIIDKKWRDNNPEKWLEIQRNNSKTNYKRHKENYLVRNQTKKKYGKLSKGYEYHHTTNPYHIDKFVVVEIADHHKIHKESGNNATKGL